jgi:hypothetical protein
MDKKLLLLSALLISFLTAKPVCTLTAKCTGGNWNAASTWNPSGCGGITTPTHACIIIIPACATVNVNINSPEYVDMEIYVYGTLDFGNGQKINMCPGYIKVFAGGQLTGGTPGSKIDICGGTVWNGGTTTGGPIEFGGNTTLPIELVLFGGEKCGEEVCLEWKTATEINNEYFNIQRSTDGIAFENIGRVEGAGNSSTSVSYNYTDVSPYQGISYYRLKQNDFNGLFSYSDMVAVEFRRDEFRFDLYPNPNNGTDLNLVINASEEEEVLVVIKDITGKESYSKIIIIENKGDNIIALDPSEKLGKGIYFIIASSKQEIYSRKMIVN